MLLLIMSGPSLLAHIGVESVAWVGGVVDHSTGAICLQHAVLATHQVSIATLPVRLEVSTPWVTHLVPELIPGMVIVALVVPVLLLTLLLVPVLVVVVPVTSIAIPLVLSLHLLPLPLLLVFRVT